MRRVLVGWFVGFALLALPVEGQVGRAGVIRGRVVDEDGRALPGTAVEVRLRDGRVVVRLTTDAAGRFLADELASGTYDVQARLLSYRTVEARGVQLVGADVHELLLVLPPAPTELAALVVRVPPLALHRVNAEIATTLDERTIPLLPVLTDPKALVAFTPGARAEGVWGGADVQANNYQIDGLAMNHPGVGGESLQLSVNWLERVQVRGLGAGAEHGNFQGGLINFVTKSGSNVRQGYARLDLESHRYNETNLRGSEVGVEQRERHDVEAETRGPILRDRLYYYVAGQHTRRSLHAVDRLVPQLGRIAPVFDDRSETKLFGKLSWDAAAHSRVDVAAGTIQQHGDRFGVSGYEAEAALQRLRAPSSFGLASWRHAGARGTLDARVLGFGSETRREPLHGQALPGVETLQLTFMRRFRNAPFAHRSRARGVTASLVYDVETTLLGVPHQLRFGGNHARGSWLDLRERTAGMTWRPVPGAAMDPADPTTWGYAGTLPVSYGGAVDLHADTRNSALFVQDHIAVTPWLLLLPGVRYGAWQGWLVPAGDATRRFRAVSANALEPRAGAVLDFADGAGLVVRGHYGRYHQNMFTQIFERAAGGDIFQDEELWHYRGPAFTDPGRIISAAERDALAAAGAMQLVERVALNQTGPVVDYRQPYVEQYVAGVEKLLGARWKAELAYVWRENRRMVALVDRNQVANYHRYNDVIIGDRFGTLLDVEGRYLRLPQLFVPHSAINAQIAAACSGFAQRPLPPGFACGQVLHWDPDYVLTNVPEAERRFRQWQVTLTGALPAATVTGSLARSWLVGNLDRVSGYEDAATFGAGPFVRPNERTNFRGWLPNLSRHEIKLLVTGDLPLGTRGSAFYQRASGDYYTPYFILSGELYTYRLVVDDSLLDAQLPGALVGAVAGERVFLNTRGSRQHPARASLDLRVEKAFRRQRTEWVLGLTAINALGEAAITSRNAATNDLHTPFAEHAFGAPLGRQAPRSLRFSGSVRF